MAGTIRKRGDSWQALLSWRDPETYKSMQISATRKTKKEAELALADLMVKRDEGRLVLGRETFGQLADRYLSEISVHKAPRTLESERLVLTKHLAVLNPKPVKRLTALDFDRLYTEWSQRGLEPSTQHHMRAVASTVMEQARRWGWCAVNPVRDSRRIESPRKPIATYEAAQLGQLLDAADVAGVATGALVRFWAVTGARRSEACALQWRDVELDGPDAGKVTIRQSARDHGTVGPTKTRQVREVMVDPGTVARLRRLKVECSEMLLALGVAITPDHFVFGAGPRFDRPLSPDTATDRFNLVRARAGTDGLTIRDLRHTVATMLLDRGMALPAVAEVLGHADGTTTLKFYAAAVKSSNQRAADIMAETMLGGGQG